MSTRPPLVDLVACAERELRMRRKVYPRWIEGGQMQADVAARELAAMAAIVDVLRELALGAPFALDGGPGLDGCGDGGGGEAPERGGGR